MNWINRKVESFIVTRVMGKVVAILDGKKTTIGCINLGLWILIYAMPAFTPDYNWVTEYATKFRDMLNDSGIVLDNSLFNAGAGFTVVGLVDKVRKLYKENKCQKINEQEEKKS